MTDLMDVIGKEVAVECRDGNYSKSDMEEICEMVKNMLPDKVGVGPKEARRPLPSRIRSWLRYRFSSSMPWTRDRRVSVSLCCKCDGACCRCIGVPRFLPEFKKIFGAPVNWLKPHSWQHLYAIIFSAIFMVDEDPVLIQKYLTRSGIKLKRCRARGGDGRCRLHAFQPWYCYTFDCGGHAMAYHDHKAGLGLPVPEHAGKGLL